MTLFKDQSHTQPPSGSPALFWREVIRMALLALAYWITVRLGLLLVAQPEGIASIWPASGLTLAILLLYPKSYWSKLLAIIFFTNAIGNWSGSNSLPVSLGFALANTLEPFLGAWLVTYFCKSRITFARTLEVVTLLLIATLANGVTALLGAAVSMLAFHTSFVNNWWVWWAADGLGIILVTPFIITWRTRPNTLRSISPLRLIESVLLALVLAIFAWLLFGPFTVAEQPALHNYMIFPLLIWLAFRFSPRSMSSALLLFTIIAIWNTLQGCGIFAFTDQTQTERLISVQIFLSFITFSGLLLSAIVTERRQAEEALIASEEKWRLLVKAIPDYVSLHDSEGRFIFLNHYAKGFSEKDVIGSSVFQYLSPKSLEIFKRSIENCRSTGTLQKFEHTAMGDNGVMREYDDYVIPIIEKNEPAKILLVSRDVTERKRTENQLLEAERRFRIAQDISLDAFTILQSVRNEQGQIVDFVWTYANPIAARILNQQPEKLIGQRLLEILPDNRANKMLFERYVRIVETGQGDDVELEYHSEEITGWFRNMAVKLDDGVAVAFNDITERKLVEEALRESKERFKGAFEHSPIGMALISPEGKWLQVNSEVCSIVGYSEDELLTKTFQDITHPDDMQVDLDYVHQMLAGEIDTYKMEKRYFHKEGNIIWVLLSVTLVKDNAGSPLYFISQIEDITERKHAENELRESERNLKEAQHIAQMGRWQLDLVLNTMQWSDDIFEIFEIDRAKFGASYEAFLNAIHPDDREMVNKAYADSLKNKLPYNIEHRLLMKDGRTKWVNEICRTEFAANGKALFSTGIVQDITARKQNDATLRSRLWLSQFADSHTLDELLQSTLNEIESLTESQIGFAHFLDADEKTISLQIWSTNTLKNMCTAEGKAQHYPVEQAGVWAECVHTREPVIHNDYASLPNRKGMPDVHTPVTRELVVPVLRGERIVAIFGVGNKPTDYNIQDVKAVSQLADMVWEIVLRKHSEDEIYRTKEALAEINKELQTALAREKQLARTDALTGVKNRRYLFELTEHAFDVATRYQQPLSVMMIDIDHFKAVNDIFGHALGDQILQRVTQSACAELRSADIIGRYGGDEFVIVLPMTNAEQAYPLAERIRESVAAIRVSTSKRDAAVTLSIGIAEMINITQAEYPTSDNIMDDILHRADEAMYAAKQAGRNCTVISEK